ncbi:GGDEF domain-containing protein [Rhizobium sp. 2YAF20]|uniref:GGDEF domain-containing protein n=1 Tax=Rhizobium sp. 2YAF20 TaxID=3233027 RepID=UPI003F98E8C0
MKKWISLQAELGNFHRRESVYVFSLKMSFLAVILSLLMLAALIPALRLLGLLPLPLTDAIRYGVLLSWLLGGVVSGALALLSGSAIHDLSLSRAEFERLSRTDALSGLLNRRAFTEALDGVEENASLVIFDLDRFKAINDQHGHASGDAVIVAISRMLADIFDGKNLVARLGGEEFAVIVCGGSVEDRLARIEEVKALVAESVIPIDSGEVRITISAGIADIWPGRKKEAVYGAADKALYLAKALGRNRIVHESERLQPAWQRQVEDTDAPDHKGLVSNGEGPRHGYGV